MTDTNTNINAAINFIDASQVDSDHYVYYADEVSAWYLTSAASVLELAELLAHDDSEIASDAYSHWCAGDYDAVELQCESDGDVSDAIAEARLLLVEA